MTRIKTAVIGSGIAGSGIAALLARTGDYDVDLYEANGIVGGRFATVMHQGFRLDIGCHMIANGPRGAMGKILDLLGEPEAVRWRHVSMEESIFFFKGTPLHFPSEIDRIGFAQEELGRLMQFFSDTLSIPEKDLPAWDDTSLVDRMEAYLRDPRARTLFGYLSSIYFVVHDDETPVGEWARCSREMMVENLSGGYPIGGTGAIPRAYVEIFERHGGRLHLACPVRRILVEDGRACGIELPDGTRRPYDLIISNAGLKPTVGKLVGRQNYPEAFLEKVDGYAHSLAWGVAKVALNEPVIRDAVFVLCMGGDDLNDRMKELERGQIPEKMDFMMIPVISNLDPSACPAGRQLLVAGGVAGLRSCSTSAEREKWKQAYLRGLEEVFPGIGRHVLWMEYTSPGDIDNLFGKDGCVIGISQKLGQVGANRPPLADPFVRNLYHCSADSGLHGIGGELAADSALRLYALLCGRGATV
jgi:phytoene dehydrogenase-like protein